jgi:hypothetical protein
MRRRASGRFELPIPASEAIDYFTPEGERSWAPGWDPTYPAGVVSETPGTAFITQHGDTQTFWVIEKIDREATTSAYSRITPGHHAGTVRVNCVDAQRGGCVVHVAYDMTLLPGGDPSALDAYDETSFEKMMNHWHEFVCQNL